TCIVNSGFSSLRIVFFFFSSRRRHTRFTRDWSSDVCSSDLDGFDIPQRYLFLQQLAVYAHLLGVGQRALEAVGQLRCLHRQALRSEERRVGIEWRSILTPSHSRAHITVEPVKTRSVRCVDR